MKKERVYELMVKGWEGGRQDREGKTKVNEEGGKEKGKKKSEEITLRTKELAFAAGGWKEPAGRSARCLA